mmetsp:Transcript_37147/g.73949  ORF Transcript_37147/g.73949 Transcript_37147/m.73949 type:complete len:289 (+) Transcript_37147:419-1285(+)
MALAPEVQAQGRADVDLPGRQRRRRRGHGGVGGGPQVARHDREGATAPGLQAPVALQRDPPDRCLPAQRLHQGGDEGELGDQEDLRPPRCQGFVHRRARAHLPRPFRGHRHRDGEEDRPEGGPRGVAPGRRRQGRGRPSELPLPHALERDGAGGCRGWPRAPELGLRRPRLGVLRLRGPAPARGGAERSDHRGACRRGEARMSRSPGTAPPRCTRFGPTSKRSDGFGVAQGGSSFPLSMDCGAKAPISLAEPWAIGGADLAGRFIRRYCLCRLSVGLDADPRSPQAPG